ncbi:four helix bundle protein [Vibrio vulnificus]|uniref:four helix bundle protein n=1 Tax=Vibrio vulnificus TaxID=672 RepID=UPI001A308521|nr:four helix bundle protein [Vibrio vulnificus]HDY7589846.1 four helix bundle protein [Vibrio vulnificus]HDY7665799.1 four helix bundle protein [Vibrio vulnificus]HDY7670992.1 four helix bundle protein [Vibrio vulnificus]HDY8141632.1 four helix bundle protein [Vibrio vulnificus]
MRVLGFERLEVWKKSSRLSVDIVKALYRCKNYALVDQITRSSLSIPSNISEGEERETAKESARFLYIAKGSCGEMITQLYIAIELGYISKEQGMAFVQDAKHISVMLAKLIKIRKGTVR